MMANYPDKEDLKRARVIAVVVQAVVIGLALLMAWYTLTDDPYVKAIIWVVELLLFFACITVTRWLVR